MNGSDDALGRYGYRRRFSTGRLWEKCRVDVEVVHLLRGVVVWKVERERTHECMTRSREY